MNLSRDIEKLATEVMEPGSGTTGAGAAPGAQSP
jgi:hypothetical protein